MKDDGCVSSGALKVRVGSRVPKKPEIAVVVMSTDSDSRTWHAVNSVLNSSSIVEVAVVNTGRGSLESILSEVIEDIVLVESEEKRFPGGTRNIGIRNTCAPIVAFLAADCIASEGWCEKRVLLHQSKPVIASSLLPAPSRGRVGCVSWASYQVTHPERIPGMRARIALPYGLSYARSIFDEFGLFDEDIRTGEDSLFNRKILPRTGPDIKNDVVTLHCYPDNILDALVDQYQRGGREFSYYKITRSRGRAALVARNVKRFSIASFFILNNRRRHPYNSLFVTLPIALGLLVAKIFGNIFLVRKW